MAKSEVIKDVNSKQKNLCAVWNEANEHLQKAKEMEKEARNLLIKSCFAKEKSVEGITTLNMGNGWQIKFKNPFTRSFDEKKLTPVLMKKFPPKIRKLLFIEKYSLGVKVYKKLSAAERKIVDRALITKPGSSSIEVVPPKE